MADPASAYQAQPGVGVPFQDNYLLKGQQLPPSLHSMPDPKMAAPATTATLLDDRAQYKQTLGKFLSSSGNTKKSGEGHKVRPGEGKKADDSDDTDSDEDEVYTKKKHGAGRDDDKEKVQKKFKIFDDNDCEGEEGSDDDDDDDDSGDDDEEYEDEVDDDSDQDDDLMSSADDNNSGGDQKDSKQSTDPKQGEIVEKASFQTAIDCPDEDVKIVRSSDQMALKSVEVVTIPETNGQPKQEPENEGPVKAD